MLDIYRFVTASKLPSTTTMASNILFSSILVQLFWTALSLAAPVGDEKLAATDVGNTWTYASSGGVIGFIVLILDIIVFSMLSAFNSAV